MIPIRESYKDYWPPQYAQSTIAKLLLNLPTRCLWGAGVRGLNQCDGDRQRKDRSSERPEVSSEKLPRLLPPEVETRASVDRDLS
jgi:hypothetical protein